MANISVKHNTIKEGLQCYGSTQFLKFLLVGGTAFIMNYGTACLTRVALSPVRFTLGISIAMGYIVGTLISFVLNKTFTFKAYDEKLSLQAIKFMLVAISSLLLTTMITYFFVIGYDLAGFTFLPSKSVLDSTAHFLALTLATIYNYLAMKHYSFKKKAVLD